MRRMILSMMWAAALACGETTSGTVDGGETSGVDAGTNQVVGCNGDARAVAFTAGMTVASADGAVKVKVLSGDPQTPARGDNRWTVELYDGADQKLSGAALAVVPFMPDHGHGSAKTPVVTSGADGSYEVTPLNFSMPGVWRVTFEVTSSGGTIHDAIVHICIAG